MRKRGAMCLGLILFAVGIGLVIPLLSEGGCPPNTTCPDYWEVLMKECRGTKCDIYNPEGGYCFMCVPPVY